MSHNKSDKTAAAGKALETSAREFAKHSGPSSTSQERDAFERDLRTAALQYARAYYAEARELGLIPEYERATPRTPPADPGPKHPYGCGCNACEHFRAEHGS